MDNATAVARTQAGAKVVLVRRETNPEDLQGMVVSEGILTACGGKTSHAAVVARGMGRCCVVGADDLLVDEIAGTMKAVSGKEFRVGDIIAIDGTTGEVFEGEVAVTDFGDHLPRRGPRGRLAAASSDDDKDLVAAVDRIMTHADKKRRMLVRANADSPEDAQRARDFGAHSIGLCRTGAHVPGERRKLIEKMILAHDEETQTAAPCRTPRRTSARTSSASSGR